MYCQQLKDAAGFSDRIFGVQDGTAQGNAVHACMQDRGYVIRCDTSDGDNGQADSCRPHPASDASVSFETQYGRKPFFGGGEAEWAAADVVGSPPVMSDDIFKCVGRSSDDKISSQPPACLVYRAVPQAQMHTIGSDFFCQFYVVVDNEPGIVVATQRLYA